MVKTDLKLVLEFFLNTMFHAHKNVFKSVQMDKVFEQETSLLRNKARDLWLDSAEI